MSLRSDDSVISADIGRSIWGYHLSGANGQLSPSLLSSLGSVALTGDNIAIEDLSLSFSDQWRSADGTLSWPGGTAKLTTAEQVALGAMSAAVYLTDTDPESLALDVIDANQNNLAKVSINPQGMLDAQVYRRLVSSSPNLAGTGSLDEVILSTALPISAIGSL